MRPLDELRRRHVYAILIEIEGVFLGRQPEIAAGLGQNLRADKFFVIRELLLERSVSLLIARDFVFLVQFANAIGQELLVSQIFFHLNLRREKQPGLFHVTAREILGQFGDRRVTTFLAGITLQPHQRLLLSVSRNLVVEQRALPQKNRPRHVEVGQLIFLVYQRALDVVFLCLDKDLQILPHQGIAFFRQPRFQFGQNFALHRACALEDAGLQVNDFLVEPFHSLARIKLGREFRLRLQHDAGVLVAALHPGRNGRFFHGPQQTSRGE